MQIELSALCYCSRFSQQAECSTNELNAAFPETFSYTDAGGQSSRETQPFKAHGRKAGPLIWWMYIHVRAGMC